MLGAYAGGYYLRELRGQYPKTGEALYLIGAGGGPVAGWGLVVKLRLCKSTRTCIIVRAATPGSRRMPLPLLLIVVVWVALAPPLSHWRGRGSG
jgi:hypothetical protein